MVLGAELGRRFKKREKERQRGLSRKQLSLKTLGALCPRPDPSGRSAAPPSLAGADAGTGTALRGRPEGATGFPHEAGGSLGAKRAVPARPIRRGWGSGLEDARQAVWWWFCEGAGSTGKETSGWETAAAELNSSRQPPQALAAKSLGRPACAEGTAPPLGRQLLREVAFPRDQPLVLRPLYPLHPPGNARSLPG